MLWGMLQSKKNWTFNMWTKSAETFLKISSFGFLAYSIWGQHDAEEMMTEFCELYIFNNNLYLIFLCVLQIDKKKKSN